MTGTAAALPVWIDVMGAALAGLDLDPFEIPDGVVWKDVCVDSGLLAVPACPERYREIFLENREPVETCPLHGESRHLDLWDDSSFEELDRQARERAARGG
jgi:penicillin-binding protein 1B